MNNLGPLLLCGCLAACTTTQRDIAATRTDGFIRTDDGVSLYYVAQGSGNVVLVAPMAVYLEPHLFDALSKNHRVIFYDPRNRGRSESADLSTVSLERQILDLEALRSELDIDEMALLGWSGLGMEMAVYALRYPSRVTRLIQLSAVPPAAAIMRAAGDARGDRVDRDAIDALDRRADAGEFDNAPADYCRLRNALTGPANFVNPDLLTQVPDLCEYENEWPANLWPYFGALLPSFGDYDWRADLRDLDVPRLIIHCREDGIPLAGAKAWTQGYPTARWIVLSPCGHFPFIEQHDKVIAAIDQFLGGDWPSDAIAIRGDNENGT